MQSAKGLHYLHSEFIKPTLDSGYSLKTVGADTNTEMLHVIQSTELDLQFSTHQTNSATHYISSRPAPINILTLCLLLHHHSVTVGYAQIP